MSVCDCNIQCQAGTYTTIAVDTFRKKKEILSAFFQHLKRKNLIILYHTLGGLLKGIPMCHL